MTPPGRFIVFEGGEGAGKTTVATNIANRLADKGIPFKHVREPGGTPAGEKIRTLLFSDLTPWGEAFAFLLARAELVARVIRPALDAGDIVLCDRFTMSTLAYQGYARGLDLDNLRRANDAATGGLTPHLTVFIDVPPDVGLRRKHGEGDTIKTGMEGLDFHKRVYDGYKTLVREAGPAAVTIDGTRPVKDIVATVWAALNLG